MSDESSHNAKYSGAQGSDSRPIERHFDHAAFSPPGRVPGEDSIEASQEGTARDDEGYEFTGYESQMATRIGTEGSDDPEAERLRQLHEGRHQSDGGHSARETERDKERIAQAICSNLPLTKREREHIVHVVKNINLDQFGNQKGLPKVTLGLVAVLVDEQHRDPPDELDDLVSRSDEFKQIRDTHDISMSDMSTVKETAREELENLSVSINGVMAKRDPALPEPTKPGDLPRQYWDELSAQSWVYIARDWSRREQAFKDAIPHDYRETIDLLRKWKPWEDEEEEPKVEESPAVHPDSEPLTEDDVDGHLDDQTEAEAKALLEQMSDGKATE